MTYPYWDKDRAGTKTEKLRLTALFLTSTFYLVSPQQLRSHGSLQRKKKRSSLLITISSAVLYLLAPEKMLFLLSCSHLQRNMAAIEKI